MPFYSGSAAFCLLRSHHVLLYMFRLVASDCLSCLAALGHSLSSLFMAIRRNSDGCVLVVVRQTKVCRGEVQAVLGCFGGILPLENFGKMEPNPAILCILELK